jgi:hypothetical protein
MKLRFCIHVIKVAVPAGASLVLAGACTTVARPATDATAPDVTLVATRESSSQSTYLTVTATTTSGRKRLEVCPADTVVLRANAEDRNGGVRQVSVSGSGSGPCSAGASSTRPISQTASGPNAGVGTQVPVKRTTAQNVAIADFACANAQPPNPLVGNVVAEATNYVGGSARTAAVEFRYPPDSYSCTGDPCFVPLNASLNVTRSESCNAADTVQVGQHAPRVVIQAGQCRGFAPRPNAQPVQWWCVGPNSPIPSALSPNQTDCPTGSNFIRVTRPATGSGFTIACHTVP